VPGCACVRAPTQLCPGLTCAGASAWCGTRVCRCARAMRCRLAEETRPARCRSCCPAAAALAGAGGRCHQAAPENTWGAGEPLAELERAWHALGKGPGRTWGDPGGSRGSGHHGKRGAARAEGDSQSWSVSMGITPTSREFGSAFYMPVGGRRGVSPPEMGQGEVGQGCLSIPASPRSVPSPLPHHGPGGAEPGSPCLSFPAGSAHLCSPPSPPARAWDPLPGGGGLCVRGSMCAADSMAVHTRVLLQTCGHMWLCLGSGRSLGWVAHEGVRPSCLLPLPPVFPVPRWQWADLRQAHSCFPGGRASAMETGLLGPCPPTSSHFHPVPQFPLASFCPPVSL